MKEYGFFGGSFDPIQFGHLNLIIEIKEKLNLQKILICPASITPFKMKNPPKTKAKDRLEMLRIALKNLKDFEIIELEIKQEKVSYTIDTLNILKNNYKKLRLIITEEALLTFHLWKDYKKVLEIAPPIVGVRNKYLKEFKSENFTLTSKNFVKTNIFEISSTDVRQRLKKRIYASHLVPKEVLDYIYQRKLYF
jgi:nicotinate-nucleotide adenylyltransferase